MPISTCATALRSQITEETALLANPTISTHVSKPIVTSKTTRKCRSQKKQKQLNAQPLITSTTRSFDDTIKSFAHLVGEPVCRGRKGKKNKKNVSKSDLPDLSSDEH